MDANETTFDTYGHLIEGSRDEVRRRMDAYPSRDGEAVSVPAADSRG